MGFHNNRRHHRRAAKGDLGLKPRFSPTAVFSTSTTPDPSTAPADSITPIAGIPSTKTSTPTPVTTTSLTPVDPFITSTSSSSSPSIAVLPTTITSSTPSTSTTAVLATTPFTSTPTPLVTETLPSTSVAAATLFTTIPPASSTSSSAPSTSATTGAGTSTSAIVGGIAGGLVGVAAVIIFTMFLVRKWRKRGLEETDFNPDAFKRQSAILVDDEPYPARGFNPRPPTMIERRMAGKYDSPPPVPSLQQYYNVGNNNSGGYENEYDNSPYSPTPSFGPGQVMSPPPNGFSAYSPQSAYDQQAELNRYPSSAGTVHAQAGHLSRHASNAGGLINPYGSGTDPAHYVNLDRSSVTPFQAAQYAEISRKLNTEPPAGLGAVQEGEEVPVSAAIHYADGAGTTHLSLQAEQGNADPESPFADPHAQVAQILANHQHSQSQEEKEEQDILVPPRAITDSAAPGSPVYSLHPAATPTPERVLSIPPSLPEIRVGAGQRAFSPTSYDFPQTPSMRPSPFGTSSHFAQEQETCLPGIAVTTDTPDPAPEPTVAKREPKTNAQRPLSSHTVYDEADAYGGI